VRRDRLSDDGRSQFAAVVAERPDRLRDLLGPEVMASPYRPKSDPDVFAYVEALEHTLDAYWVVRGLLAATPEGPILRQLTVEPWPPEAPIEVTGTVLRSLKPARIRDEALASLRLTVVGLSILEGTNWALPAKQAVALRAAAAKVDVPAAIRKRGRQPLPDEHWRAIALECLRLQEERGGNPRGVLGELARIESRRRKREIPRETIRDWVKTARKGEWLARTRQGRAGFAPGPRLVQELQTGASTIKPVGRRAPGKGKR
jgi:hypothetical protein